MASFAKFVTSTDGAPPSVVSAEDPPTGVDYGLGRGKVIFDEPEHETLSDPTSPVSPTSPTSLTPTGLPRSRANSLLERGLSLLRTTSREATQTPGLESTIYTSTEPFSRPPFVSNMVRERVSITGVVRELEAVEEMSVLRIDKEDLGRVKEAPVKRYLAGSESLSDARSSRRF